MTRKTDVQPIPEGYHSLTPYLTVHDAAAALDFYREAFGAEETFRMDGPQGKVVHAEMKIGDSHVMLADELEAWGNRSPRSLGGTATSLMIYVDDSDAVFRQAVDAGATEVMPVQDHFYGDRSGSVEDPFGHRWTVATHVEDVPPEDLERRAKEAMAQM